MFGQTPLAFSLSVDLALLGIVAAGIAFAIALALFTVGFISTRLRRRYIRRALVVLLTGVVIAVVTIGVALVVVR